MPKPNLFLFRSLVHDTHFSVKRDCLCNQHLITFTRVTWSCYTVGINLGVCYKFHLTYYFFCYVTCCELVSYSIGCINYYGKRKNNRTNPANAVQKHLSFKFLFLLISLHTWIIPMSEVSDDDCVHRERDLVPTRSTVARDLESAFNNCGHFMSGSQPLRLRWSRGSVLAFGTQVRGFKPGRSRRIFRGEKILSTPSFGGEVKPSVPCRRFTACKRSLNVP